MYMYHNQQMVIQVLWLRNYHYMYCEVGSSLVCAHTISLVGY